MSDWIRYTLVYRLQTWRCWLLGHSWGPEQSDPNTEARLQAWEDCERPHCDAYRETFHFLGPVHPEPKPHGSLWRRILA